MPAIRQVYTHTVPTHKETDGKDLRREAFIKIQNRGEAESQNTKPGRGGKSGARRRAHGQKADGFKKASQEKAALQVTPPRRK
jgi:DNA-binding PucR family transcriptional regulator